MLNIIIRDTKRRRYQILTNTCNLQRGTPVDVFKLNMQKLLYLTDFAVN